MSDFVEINNVDKLKQLDKKIKSIHNAEFNAFLVDINQTVSVGNNKNTFNQCFDFTVGKINEKIFYEIVRKENNICYFRRYYDGKLSHNEGTLITTVTSSDSAAYTELIASTIYINYNTACITAVDTTENDDGYTICKISFIDDGGKFLETLLSSEVKSCDIKKNEIEIIFDGDKIISITMSYVCENVISEDLEIAIDFSMESKMTFK